MGIAEQHAVTFAAGLACEGLRPFCAIYSTFLQRGYDQIIHDVALQNLPGAQKTASAIECSVFPRPALSASGRRFCCRQHC